MKEPKYVLQIAGQQFVVASDQGILTLIRMMEDVVPVHADLRERKIELTYTDQGEEQYLRMLEFFREVRIRKIPPGVKWSRKAPDGSVQEVRVVAKPPKALKEPARKALRGPERPALPPPSNQLSLL